ncbi:hypothetical protein [Paludisphaera mucosa]|uniref:Lipoprotein n=1 Tax=Paludisphaera mucosa TaxID=3030827 RepID=A0ABT6F9F5_9BACT|nr:hypothetical protein [Paludisphaera mucosa]MDG3004218.1 hypothetical protein [Paludisphaera mucosa]
MKLRHMAAASVACAFILSLVGCDSGGVDAISAGSVNNSPGATAGGGTVPKTLPKHKRRGPVEAPGPKPPPDV